MIMYISSPDENITTNEDKSNNNDGKDLGGLFQINSFFSKGPFVIDLQLEKKLPGKESDPLNFKIVPLNNGTDTNMSSCSAQNSKSQQQILLMNFQEGSFKVPQSRIKFAKPSELISSI